MDTENLSFTGRIVRVLKIPLFQNQPHIWSIFFRSLRNLLAGIGLLTIFAILFFYYQGKQAIKPFQTQFMDISTEFARKALLTDVANALVVKTPLQKDVTLKKARQAMIKRGKQMKIPLIKRYVLHEAIDKKKHAVIRHTEILQFCNADIAYGALQFNPAYLVHMPCRIGLYEDELGQAWLITMDLNLLIYGGRPMPPALHEQALYLQDALLAIIAAGSSGKALADLKPEKKENTKPALSEKGKTDKKVVKKPETPVKQKQDVKKQDKQKKVTPEKPKKTVKPEAKTDKKDKQEKAKKQAPKIAPEQKKPETKAKEKTTPKKTAAPQSAAKPVTVDKAQTKPKPAPDAAPKLNLKLPAIIAPAPKPAPAKTAEEFPSALQKILSTDENKTSTGKQEKPSP
ncbi:DUF302 domain-containing protein [Candidatus Venteria ishoeyi]|uniref:DUF302 domain-containing protein n=1 Tax=Candidatus Venteria ishoeyi TaxID=1899563 RepID=A0A1H6FF73_9GAMM|nr:DUF302 domain-containing protein [Candidatus Venteria ishoeyi]MDM8546133.1 DUF302 domain-containing protein [Candidatus Venteria ishoeyi]SEH07999.1 Uncharacterised protein [Candidatus Venteria ishoeyi]